MPIFSKGHNSEKIDDNGKTFRPWQKSQQSFKLIGIKLYEELHI